MTKKWQVVVWFFWNALDPVVVIVFEKNIYVVKITSPERIKLKLQRPDQVHFKKIYNDWIRQTLVIFLSFFEKNYNNWIKCKLPDSNGQG